MPNKKRVERLQIMLNEDELSLIDDWRFEQRMPTRAAAVRALLLLGIEKSSEIKGPLLSEPMASTEIGLATGEDGNGVLNFNGKKKVLVVEDEYLIGQGICNIVEREGYAVIGPAASEAEAFACMESERPDGAIVDLLLRGKSAVSLVEALKKAKTPVILCTAQDPKKILPEGLADAPIVNKLAVEKLLPERLRLFAN